jgi:Fic family protein
MLRVVGGIPSFTGGSDIRWKSLGPGQFKGRFVMLFSSTCSGVCSTITGIEMRVRQVPRTTLVAEQTGEVIYTPPAGQGLLRDLLANLEKFLHVSADLDPLIRLAVGHYQFEAIHPFTDGNGRTGRVLNNLFMIQERLLTLPILYLSDTYLTKRRTST